MKSEEALWSAALALIGEHDAEAPARAAREADAAFERCDLDAVHHWRIMMRRASILVESGAATTH